MKKKFDSRLLKPLFGLAAFVIICGFLARYLTDSETLADYAKKNPEAAYGTNNEETSSSSTPDSTSENLSINIDDSHIDKTNEAVEPDKDADTMKATNTQTNTISSDRVTYQEGFYYESLTGEVKEKITGISYPVSAKEADSLAVPAVNMLAEDALPAISYDDLCYMSILHYDFYGEIQTGELICNKKIAEDLVEIFYELYQNEYQIEKIKLIDEYNGDDTASMTDNNTSCFNYRVVDGTTSLSKHALGCAIDINPFYNPYVVFNKDGSGETYISPEGSEAYADRSKDFPYKIDENDLCYKLFKEHGFVWGGDWNSCKDYQHFQKVVE
ncbi:MAG: M15 family metallopeptidase [Lachnospiraceae bacterium]|nr:M15 family metallopeptidase [Lachnospiraceae bacterium]